MCMHIIYIYIYIHTYIYMYIYNDNGWGSFVKDRMSCSDII